MLTAAPRHLPSLFLAGLLIGCGNQAVGDGSGGTDGPVCQSVQPTTGGNYGDPFFPPGTDTLDPVSYDVGGMGETGSAVIPPPPVTRWEYSPAHGVYYRRATGSEILSNGWADSTLLFIQQDLETDLSLGRPVSNLSIPLADDPTGPVSNNLFIASVDLEIAATSSYSLGKARVFKNPWAPRGAPTLLIDNSIVEDAIHFYLHENAAWAQSVSVPVALWGSAGGQIAGWGMAEDRTFYIRGPFKKRVGTTEVSISPPVGDHFFLVDTAFHGEIGTLAFAGAPGGRFSTRGAPLRRSAAELELATPTGSSLTPVAAQTCNDGFDNDLDVDGDGCDWNCVPHNDFGAASFDHAQMIEQGKTFGLFPDGIWCTENQDSWELQLVAAGVGAANLLNMIDVPPEFGGGRGPLMRMLDAGCFVFPSLTSARDCHDAAPPGECPVGYPYEDIDGTIGDGTGFTGGYIGTVWDAAQYWAGVRNAEGKLALPIHSAIAISTRYDDLGVVGRTYTDYIGGDAQFLGGGTILWTTETVVTPPRIAHELGHSLGLPHDITCLPGELSCGFMNAVGGRLPILGEWDSIGDADWDFQGLGEPYEVWRDESTRKDTPRSPGFHWSGCNNDSECEAVYAGSTCATGPGICLKP